MDQNLPEVPDDQRRCEFCGTMNPAYNAVCELCHKKFPLNLPVLPGQDPGSLAVKAVSSTVFLGIFTAGAWFLMGFILAGEPWFWPLFAAYWVLGMVIDYLMDPQDPSLDDAAHDPALNYDRSIASNIGTGFTAFRIVLMPPHIVRTSWVAFLRSLKHRS